MIEAGTEYCMPPGFGSQPEQAAPVGRMRTAASLASPGPVPDAPDDGGADGRKRAPAPVPLAEAVPETGPITWASDR